MPRIAVEIVINAPASFVWQDVEDIAGHVGWMKDASHIRFLSDQQRGLGTRFECDTKVGPLKVTDVMEVTKWQETKTLEVQHQGMFGGTGAFTLRPSGSTTVISWVEDLKWPWYVSGPFAAALARPILKSIWKGNLVRLKQHVETRYVEQRYETNSG